MPFAREGIRRRWKKPGGGEMTDEEYMLLALGLAKEAALHGETPVGAVVVDPQGRVIGRGRNRVEEQDATCHAEIQAIRDAAERLGAWRLEGYALYVTMEPCPMCAGAVYNARMERLIYGARDPRAGACGGLFNLFMEPLDRKVKIYGGVLEPACKKVLAEFFKGRR